VGHYIHRSLIYPWFRSSFSRKWPLESVIYHAVTNCITSTIAFHGIIFAVGSLHWSIQLLLALGFVGCAVGAGIHDYKLCALRRSGDSGYQVPHGLLFQWVSGPHYLFEVIQWLFFLPFLEYGFPMATFGIYLLVNVTARAESVHDAYTKRLFRNKYPDDRTAYIPFVKNSRWLI
jgi:steroid 5-alpha reductase family enzyme